MFDIKQVFTVATYNFRRWLSARVIITFLLAFVLCFMLSDKAVSLTYQYSTTMQLAEGFVWSFGDPNSILLVSLLLMLLFADMPFINAGTPYYLIRTRRVVWLWGQIVYVALATLIFLLFILAATAIVCAPQSFLGNMWSETGAILGYSGAGQSLALPASIKTMEMSTPYACMGSVFLLMLLYTLLLVSIMLAVNIRKGQVWGIVAAFGFSLYGLFLNPDTIQKLFELPESLFYKANVAVGWLSPLNHATYYMHNFGYDYLPQLWMTYLIFIGLIALCFNAALKGMKSFNYNFTGSDV